METVMNSQSCAGMAGRFMVRAISTIILTVLFAAPVAASPTNEGEEPEQVTSKATPEGSGGIDSAGDVATSMRAVLDPERGELVFVPSRETRTLSPYLATALNRSSDGLYAFELMDGGVGVDLKGRFQHVMLARVAADGSIEMVCVDHPEDAEKFFAREGAGVVSEPAVR